MFIGIHEGYGCYFSACAENIAVERQRDCNFIKGTDKFLVRPRVEGNVGAIEGRVLALKGDAFGVVEDRGLATDGVQKLKVLGGVHGKKGV